MWRPIRNPAESEPQPCSSTLLFLLYVKSVLVCQRQHEWTGSPTPPLPIRAAVSCQVYSNVGHDIIRLNVRRGLDLRSWRWRAICCSTFHSRNPNECFSGRSIRIGRFKRYRNWLGIHYDLRDNDGGVLGFISFQHRESAIQVVI